MPITLGQKLKETRMKRGLSLAEAAFQTRIREHYLDALENDKYTNLPSTVQGKGFLRNYASFLGLDESTTERAWFHPTHLYEEHETQPSLPEEEKIADEPVEKAPQKLSPEEGQPRVVIIHSYTEDEKTSDSEYDDAIDDKRGSQVIFSQIGAKLKQQREQLNLSLDDIERFTNIRSHYLAALEKGKLEHLPSVVQGRGMLSNYANFLNLNSEEILLSFAEGLQTRRNEQYAPQRLDPNNPPKINQPNIASPGWRRFITADLLIVGTLIISLFIFILWGAANVTRNQNAIGSSTAPSLSDILLENSSNATPSLEAFITPTPLAEIATQVPADITEEQTPLVPEESSLAVNIYIIAHERAFLQVTRDGKVVFTGRTVPGNAYEFSANEQVELLTGNAAALEIYFNQQQIGSIGAVAEVKNLIFSGDGVISTPTAQFTFTPTATPISTATKQPTNTATLTPSTTALAATVTPYIP